MPIAVLPTQSNNLKQLNFADTMKHHCLDDKHTQTRPEKAGMDTAEAQPSSAVVIKIIL